MTYIGHHGTGGKVTASPLPPPARLCWAAVYRITLTASPTTRASSTGRSLRAAPLNVSSWAAATPRRSSRRRVPTYLTWKYSPTPVSKVMLFVWTVLQSFFHYLTFNMNFDIFFLKIFPGGLEILNIVMYILFNFALFCTTFVRLFILAILYSSFFEIVCF